MGSLYRTRQSRRSAASGGAYRKNLAGSLERQGELAREKSLTRADVSSPRRGAKLRTTRDCASPVPSCHLWWGARQKSDVSGGPAFRSALPKVLKTTTEF